MKTNDRLIRPDYRIPYKIGDQSRKFFSWVNVNIPRDQNVTPRMHYQLFDELIGTPEQNVQALVHRGGAKSTVMTNYLPLYVADTGELPYFGKITNLIVYSATIDQAIDQLRGIRNIWDNSPTLSESLQLARDKRGKVIADKVDYLALENLQGDVIHIQAKGAGQSMRGTMKDGVRPELNIFDDILTDLILTSELERKKLLTWFYSTIANAVDITHYKKVVVGTPMVTDDLLMKMARGSVYKTVMFPIANEFPVPVEEMVTSWKDRFTPERVMTQFLEAKEMGAEGDFYREMMLEVVNDDMRVFKDEYFKEYEEKEMDFPFEEYNHFTSMDLAVSKKESGDFVVIITIAVNSAGHWFIRRIDCEKLDPSQTIDRLFQHIRAYKPIETRAEKAALQQVLDHFIEKKMLTEKIFFNYAALENNSNQSKELRISALQPMMKMRKIHFPTDVCQIAMAELYAELKGYTKEGKTTAHDDAMDCLANFLDPYFVVAPSEDAMFYSSLSVQDVSGSYLDDFIDY